MGEIKGMVLNRPGIVEIPERWTRLSLVPERAAEPKVIVTVKRLEPPKKQPLTQLRLGSLGPTRLQLRRPLPVRLEREKEYIVAYCDELEEYGFGPHLTAALEDLKLTIVELYFTLKAERHRLGPALQPIWAKLQEVIIER